MARWFDPPHDPTPKHEPYEVGMAVFTRPTTGAGLSYFAPLHYEPNYAYPLLIWLHGEGQNENQLRKLMPHVSLRNYVAAAVRGPCPVRVNGEQLRGYTWFQTPDQIGAAEDLILDAVEAASTRFNISPARVFLAGIGAGGTMAIRVALRNPEIFAGMISLGGPCPEQLGPIRDLPAVRNMATLICHGRDSENYPTEAVCADLRTLRAIGVANIRVLHCHPCGDEIHAQMLTEIDRWVMAQILASSNVDEATAG